VRSFRRGFGRAGAHRRSLPHSGQQSAAPPGHGADGARCHGRRPACWRLAQGPGCYRGIAPVPRNFGPCGAASRLLDDETKSDFLNTRLYAPRRAALARVSL